MNAGAGLLGDVASGVMAVTGGAALGIVTDLFGSVTSKAAVAYFIGHIDNVEEAAESQDKSTALVILDYVALAAAASLGLNLAARAVGGMTDVNFALMTLGYIGTQDNLFARSTELRNILLQNVAR